MQNPSVVVSPIPTGDFKAKLTIEDRPIPDQINDDEVLLKMKQVGICGSDVHYWTHGGIGRFQLEKPMVLGHEAAGVVLKVGKNVTNVKEGDRVAIEPGYNKDNDEFAKSGKYNLSPSIYFCATPPDDGCLSKFYKHPASFCYKIPDSMSFEEGAMIEPLSVGIHACRRGGVGLASNVLIMGAGTMGQVNALIAKAMGAAKIIVVDINENRLSIAKSMGATDTVLTFIGEEPMDLSKKILEKFGTAPEVTIECSGAESSIQAAVYATRAGGIIMTVGRGKNITGVPLNFASSKEIDIRGVFRYVNTWPTAINMISSGVVDVKGLISHRVKLADAETAFELTRTGQGLKVMIDCD